MIDKVKLTPVTAVLLAGFASPLFADCLESGAAESCGAGGYAGRGYYAQARPNGHYGFGYARGAGNRRFE